MQCKNLIVLATIAIMALTSPESANPTERGVANPDLQKRGIFTTYLASKGLKKVGVRGWKRLAGAVTGGMLVSKLLKKPEGKSR
ncbi:hypothetical protein IWQ61_009185 [Dispira simplex]|nr:hypothetical protein IWQ61_009185 [Dispira simplex]